MEGFDNSFYSQGSPEWYAERLGKFTSSEMHCLMVSSKTAGETFGQGAKTYIFKKLNEHVTGIVAENDAYGTALDWGNAHEFEARDFYSMKTGNQVEECGFIPSVQDILCDIHGGSPDGLIYNKGIIEIKCPYNGANHQANMQLRSADDFKKAHKNYYTQIQSNLLATQTEFCDFISYDPRPRVEPGRMKVIRIYRDEAMINEIQERLILGHDLLLMHLENYVQYAENFEDYMQKLKLAA